MIGNGIDAESYVVPFGKYRVNRFRLRYRCIIRFYFKGELFRIIRAGFFFLFLKK